MKTTIEKVIQLQNIEFFYGIPTNQLAYLAEIARVEVLEKGDFIFKEDQPSDALYIIVEGGADIYRHEKFVKNISKNKTVGTLGFFDQQARLFTAVCSEHSILLKIDNVPFYDLLDDKIYISRYLLSYFVKKLRAVYNNDDIY